MSMTTQNSTMSFLVAADPASVLHSLYRARRAYATSVPPDHRGIATRSQSTFRPGSTPYAASVLGRA
eukprot:1748311-Rhodomonas_salina.3